MSRVNAAADVHGSSDRTRRTRPDQTGGVEDLIELPGPGCELPGPGLLAEPVAATTSLAFVLAGALVLLLLRGQHQGAGDREPARVVLHAVLVGAVGLGSFVEHGPAPAWGPVAHDVPLMATLALVAADGVADLTGRRMRWWWWGVPTAAVAPAAATSAATSTALQVTVAVVAVGVTLARAWHRPAIRARFAVALALLAVGSVVGTLSRAGGPLCDPASPWQGHGLWHVLAAAALVVLAPVVTRRSVAPGAP